MSQSIDYAFLTRIDAIARPTVFQSLDRLALNIEGKRHGQGFLLEEIEDIHARRRMAWGAGEAVPAGLSDRGVQVWLTFLDGTRDRSLGFAWLKGQGRETLQAALERAALSKGIDRHLMHAA